MDKELLKALFNLGLKKDATDEEAQAFIKEKNINVVDIVKTPPVDKSDEIKNEIKTVKEEINKRLDSVEQSIGTMNLSLTDNVEEDPMLGYKNSTDFFNDVILAGRTGKPSDRLKKAHEIRTKNAIGSDEAKVGNNPDGGFLMPEGVIPGVKTTDPQALQTDTGRLTTNIPMEAAVIKLNARVDKNHTSSVSGGFRVYRREEAATVTASKAQFEQVRLEAEALMGLTFATDEILARSPISFAALINAGFDSEKISTLNNERLRGTGAGEYMGILNSPALISQAKEGSQASDTIVGENLIKMRSRIWGYQNAVWMVNQDCYPQLTEAHITGTNGDVFLYNPGRGIDVPDSILGRPVIYDENMSTLGDVGDIMLINWSEYLEGQLGGSSFADSVHVRFVNNETAFKFNVYNAGAPWWRTALTPKQSAVTLSPFVSLAARA